MKNNLILRVKGFKRVLKGILVVIVMCSIDSLSARNMGKPTQSSETPTTQSSQTPTKKLPSSSASKDRATAQMPKLTPLAQFALNEDSYNTVETLSRFLQDNRDKLSKQDIQVIEARIKKMNKGEKLSGKDELIRSLQAQLEQQRILLAKLVEQKSPATQSKGWFDSLFDYESYLAQSISAKSATTGSLLVGGASLAAVGATTTAMVAIPVMASIYGLDRIASWIKTGHPSKNELIKALIKHFGQQIIDLGKYPTFASKISATYENDFVNTSKVEQAIYEAALAELRESTIKERDEVFKNIVAEEERQDKVDKQILDIRTKHAQNKDLETISGLQDYITALKTLNLDRSRAVVSEYLRAESKLLLKQNQETQALAGVSDTGKQPEQKSWWQKIWNN